MQTFTVMINLTVRYHSGEIIEKTLQKEFLASTDRVACSLMSRSLDGVRENATNFGFELLNARILGAIPTHKLHKIHSNNE